MNYTLGDLYSKIDVDQPNAIYIFGHNESGTVIGFLRIEIDEPAGYISAFYIEPDDRGKGLGKQMLARAYELCRKQGFKTVGLCVKEGNEGARKLYLAEGFVPYLNGQEGYKGLIKML
jgi:GNAT superfamily N-acetyltransferase